MRLLAIQISAILLLTACQTTTAPVAQLEPAKITQPAKCSSDEAMEYKRREQKIETLERETARGYRTSSTVIKVANPLKLCKGVAPFVRVCLPTPEPKSTLPTFQEHRAMKKELAELKEQQSKLANCAKS
ncbi:hypothetical protein K3556_13515 [Aliiroseovarius sp. M344]|uniref:hypothetical protein n=1 Tax=Aliiroseovarius sp. M344 TaxID=2867010 RepID=UPI0021AE1E31|nr:hypothetical protein [Aliiroseovarius sp. M344]UWQ13927.1 hypothetical protein K3556_13515 [Aliiroseovarius sp. M344]